VLRVDANAPPGTVDNIVEETPGEPPGASPVTPAVLPPGAKVASVPPPVKEAVAAVKVLAKRTARRPAPPPVTG
jgi:hypothetical protein